ncbi:MAG: putative signal transduction protein with EAL and GGDEF domain [Gammaproteobacteria bacterium]|jgi:predicted signal transduction protein with EAL and GGDEF domain
MTMGIVITLFISSVASALAFFELSIQGREQWVVGWYLLFCLVLYLRLRSQKQFFQLPNKQYFPYQFWSKRFYIGAVMAAFMQGFGVALVMPYLTGNIQIILHSLLLGMGAGAIAFLSPSLRAYATYLVMIMLPVTLWLFSQQTLDGLILGLLYIFFMSASSISVKRMNVLVNEALYYRFDSENLVEDLQRLLDSVAKSNKALEKISITDELTGVSNYRSFRVNLEEAWRAQRQTDEPLSVVKINIDFFHEFNAFYGQEKGDQTLIQVARILASELTRKQYLVARLNGG